MMSMAAPPMSPPRATATELKATPKTRRKRAPAAGAAADCFTCTSLDLQCDRRRPYCSQCLDHGKDCSGYKTQLTWGVGVASRGKLRGLSLPVAGTERLPSSIPAAKSRKRSIASPRNTKTEPVLTGPLNTPTVGVAISSETRADTNFAPLSATTTNIGPSASAFVSWNSTTQIEVPTTAPALVKIEQTLPSPSSYQTMFAAQRQDSGQARPKQARNSFHASNISTQAMRIVQGTSTIYHRQSSPQMPVTSSPTDIRGVEASNAYWTSDHNYIPPSTMGSSVPSFPTPSNQGFLNFNFATTAEPHHHGTNGWTEEAVDEEYGPSDVADEYAISDQLSPYSVALTRPSFGLDLSPFATVTSIGKTPRMQYLINYYAEVISPVIVAFDGPTNPYRTHILQLAAESETLQHAISALSASNIRQRRATGWISTGKTDPARRSSIAHLTLASEEFNGNGILSPQEQVREEALHRSLAISALNAQLADPVRRKDDSTLAVLLILCLFHICDSGIAKFQTQFAGVKKLLKMRGEDLNFNSNETKWFTRMFTWFDAMTATVNDREGQLQGYHLDVSALSDEEWALENLAGCDGQLFKTIAKLGRLNVLSQGKPVDSAPTLVCRPPPTSADYSAFDGNGWARRLAADESIFSQGIADADVQALFWREWREIRHALQTWRLNDAPSIFQTANGSSTTSDAPALSPEQRADLLHISESFRYSALLYTERLASPASASADPKIQLWVQQALHFIRLVKSDVYLLWPLFITGSECVSEVDRDVIRERCLDIQKDSGFSNNASCLELLEKVWRANPSASGKGKGKDGMEESGGFKFTRIMKEEASEGEYIVV